MRFMERQKKTEGAAQLPDYSFERHLLVMRGNYMRHIDLHNINLYHIQLFLSVAETENITVAAKKMHITQSMLSRIIKQMENSLGLQLFIREKNRLRITPAGKILYNEFSTINRSVELAIEKAHIIQEAKELPITLSWLNTVNPTEFIFPGIHYHAMKNDRLQYNVFNGSFEEIQALTLSGESDITFTSLFEQTAFDSEEYNCEVIITCPLMVYMLKDNMLVKKENITFSDLKDQNFVALSPTVSPNYMAYVIDPYTMKENYKPTISYYALNSKSIGNNLKGNHDIFIADKYFSDFSTDYLERKEISGTESGVILVWRKSAPKSIQKFALDIIEYCRTEYENLE